MMTQNSSTPDGNLGSLRAPLVSSLQATGRVLLLALPGAQLAAVRKLDEQNRKGLSVLCKNVLLPSLLIFSVSPLQLTHEHVLRWSLMPAAALLLVALGVTLGMVVAKGVLGFSVTSRDARFIMASVGFGNTTSLPIALVEAVGLASGWAPESTSEGITLICIFTLFMNVFRWSVAFRLLVPSRGSGQYATVLSTDSGVENNNDDGDAVAGEESLDPRPCLRVRVRSLIGVINPPVVASMLAAFIALVPALQSLLWGEAAPLYASLGMALRSLGLGYTPVMLTVLGSGIVLAGLRARVDGVPLARRILVAICIARLLMLPTLCALLVFGADAIGLLPSSSPMVKFVILLEGITPPAINLNVMTSLGEDRRLDAAMSFTLLITYVLSVVTMTAWVTIFLWLGV